MSNTLRALRALTLAICTALCTVKQACGRGIAVIGASGGGGDCEYLMLQPSATQRATSCSGLRFGKKLARETAASAS